MSKFFSGLLDRQALTIGQTMYAFPKSHKNLTVKSAVLSAFYGQIFICFLSPSLQNQKTVQYNFY